MLYLKTKAVWTAFAVVTLPVCCIQAQDREPAFGAKALEKSTESAADAKASEKQPEKSDSQKPLNGASKPTDKTEKAAMKRVTGIGGVFIKAKDPAKLRAWYQTHLGIDVQKFGGATFRWGDSADDPANAKSAWYVGTGSNFKPSEAPFMINYRVADLRGLLKVLREEGCQVLDKVDESKFGIFGWVMDPEGNKVELWQPPAGQ
jgi:predicted enzyme related to lactoylglutathione lyase